MCNCKSCEDSRRWNAVVERGVLAEHQQIIEELRNRLADVEEDLSYRKALLDGSWPSAYEQLERVIGKWAT